MYQRVKIITCFTLLVLVMPGFSQAYKVSKVKEVIGDVKIVGADGVERTAEKNDIVLAPAVVKTGANSRIALEAGDETIVRAGSNANFSMESNSRQINLQKGSLLVYAPHEGGVGIVRTADGKSVITGGGTVLLDTTSNGGLKLMVLEGRSHVKLQTGIKQSLEAGQMTYVVPTAKRFPGAIDFDLNRLVVKSNLVRGFKQALPSESDIETYREVQTTALDFGEKTYTNYVLGDAKEKEEFQVADASTRVNQFTTLDRKSPNSQINPGSYHLTHDQARATDLVVNKSTFNPAFVFDTTSGHFQREEADILGLYRTSYVDRVTNQRVFINDRDINGVIGQNIRIQSPHVDLSGYSFIETFFIAAFEALYIDQSSVFSGLNPNQSLWILSQVLKIAEGSVITANSNQTYFGTIEDLELKNVVLINNSGQLAVITRGKADLENTTLVSPVVTLFAAEDIRLINSGFQTTHAEVTSPGNISIINGTYNATTMELNAGKALNFINATINASSFKMEAVNDISITTSTFNTPDSLQIITKGALDFSLQAFTSRQMYFESGRTIDLDMANFNNSAQTDSRITFKSADDIFVRNGSTVASKTLSFLATDDLLISGAATTINADNLTFGVGGDFSLTGGATVTSTNFVGSFGGDFTVSGSSLNFLLKADKTVTINAGGNVSITGGTLISPEAAPTITSIVIKAVNGSVTLTGVNLQSYDQTDTGVLSVTASDNITVVGGVLAGNTFTMAAGNDLSISGATIKHAPAPTYTGRDITLSGTTFSGDSLNGADNMTVTATRDLTLTSVSSFSQIETFSGSAGRNAVVTSMTVGAGLTSFTLGASGDLSLTSSSFGSGGTFSGGGNVTMSSVAFGTTASVSAGGTLTDTSSTFSGSGSLSSGGAMTATSTRFVGAGTMSSGGNLTATSVRFDNTAAIISGADLNMTTADFNGVSVTMAANPTTGTLNYTGNGADFSAATVSIIMSAATINLTDVNFPMGSTVTLDSRDGLLADFPNTGAASVPFRVNYINNVLYNGAAAETQTGAGLPITIQ